MSIKLIPEQLEAVEMIKDAPGPTRLLGAAGMGKSTVINALGNSIPKAAPTNKAASIIGCPTIHKMLGLTIRKQGSKLVTVPTRATPRGKIRSPVVFDEASCIPKDILDTYILPVFTRPIFVGDEAQLNPVTEGGHAKDLTIPFMRDSSWSTKRLTHCHRFGEELYDVAMANRKAVLEGGTFSVPASWGIDEDELLHKYKDGDVVIAWRNVTVNKYNKIIKNHLYGTLDWVVGERIRIGEYYEPKKLANESEWVIAEVEHDVKIHGYVADRLRIKNLYGDVVVPVLQEWYVDDYNEALRQFAEVENWPQYWMLKNAFCDVRPIYAISAHKSQGSTYPNAFTDLNDIFANSCIQEAVRAAYVATTRATTKVWSLI